MMKDEALRYRKVRDEIDSFKRELEKLEAERKELEARLIDEMLKEGITSTRIEGVGLITASNKLVANIADKGKFFEWLHSTDREYLIKSDVNYMTLQAFANELEQNDLAAAHAAGLDYSEKTIISLRT